MWFSWVQISGCAAKRRKSPKKQGQVGGRHRWRSVARGSGGSGCWPRHRLSTAPRQVGGLLASGAAQRGSRAYRIVSALQPGTRQLHHTKSSFAFVYTRYQKWFSRCRFASGSRGAYTAQNLGCFTHHFLSCELQVCLAVAAAICASRSRLATKEGCVRWCPLTPTVVLLICGHDIIFAKVISQQLSDMFPRRKLTLCSLCIQDAPGTPSSGRKVVRKSPIPQFSNLPDKV